MAEVDAGSRYGEGTRHEDYELDAEQCWSLLGSSGVGRFAFVHEGRIAVYPVGYLVYGGAVHFRTSRDGTVAHSLPQDGVALQVDATQPAVQAGWSVLANGRAEAVEDPGELTTLFGQMVNEPWAGGVRDLFVRVRPDVLTGRRVFLAK
jgi:nitroimidazol reductase NimA-like FMN-containing flavoprotein (pyridoxamine 5'-phosphate oxidase superfamily)